MAVQRVAVSGQHEFQVPSVPTPPVMELSVSSISTEAIRGCDAPDSPFAVSNTDLGTLNYTITDDASWLSVTPASGSCGPLETDWVTVQYATATLAPDTYSAVIRVEDAYASNSPQEIAVSLHVYIQGDFDSDGDVDQEDFGLFQGCFSGSGIPYEAGCRDADLTRDGAVDQEDFGIFLDCMAGPNQPPGC